MLRKAVLLLCLFTCIFAVGCGIDICDPDCDGCDRRCRSCDCDCDCDIEFECWLDFDDCGCCK